MIGRFLRGLPALTRLAVRTARRSPLRSLLVVALIALVVAVGAVMTSIVSSQTDSPSDIRQAVLGETDAVIVFSSDGTTHQGAPLTSDWGPGAVQIASVVPPPPGLPGMTSEDDHRWQAHLEAIEAWNAGFEADQAISEIERALQPPTGLSWTRAAELQWNEPFNGPFGYFGDRARLLDASRHDLTANEQVRVIAGRLPGRVGEVAVNLDAYSPQGHPEVGALAQYNGVELTVVGHVVRRGGSGDPHDLVVSEDFDRLVATVERPVVEYRLYPSPGWSPLDQKTTMRTVANAIGRPATARFGDQVLFPDRADLDGLDWFVSPAVDGRRADVVTSRVVPTFATVMFSVLVAFVVAAAMAVAVRSRTRQYALVAVTGGSSAQIRALVLAEALLLGLTGVLLGVIAAIVVVQLLPYDVPFSDSLQFGLVELSPLDVLAPAAIGLGAAFVAAWWPARTVATSPPAALLGGRLPSRRPGAATVGRAVVVLAIGCGFATVATLLTRSTSTSSGIEIIPIAALGVLGMLGGAVMAVGPLLAMIGARADRFPLLARLVSRDSDRGRTRSWVAIGALMVLAMIPVLAGAAMKAYPDSFGESVSELERRLVDVRTHPRFFSVFDTEAAEADLDANLATYESIDGAIGTELGGVASATGEAAYAEYRTAQLSINTGRFSTGFGWTLIAATDEVLDVIEAPADVRAALDDGLLVDISRERYRDNGTFVVSSMDPTQGHVTVDLYRGPRLWSGTVLVPLGHAGFVNLEPTTAGTIRVTAEAITREQELAVRQAANQRWGEAFPLADEPGQPRMELRLEQSFVSGPPSATVRLWVLGITAALSLLIAALMAALSAVELDRDLESMVATGAPPNLRRKFLGAHTLYHMVIAAVLGAPTAVLLYWIAARADDFGPRGPTVPWGVIGAVVVVIPLIVATLIALSFRNGRPSVSRRVG